MIHAEMSATKKPPAKKTATDAGTPTLAEIGEAAKRTAQRTALLKALRQSGWNLTAAGIALGVGSPSNVLRAIKTLELTDEYDAAKAAGKISPGSRIDRE